MSSSKLIDPCSVFLVQLLRQATPVLNGTAKIKHVTKIPAGVTREQAVAVLQDHEFFLQCDPHLSKFTAITPEKAPILPDSVKAVNGTKCYSVTDIVHAIPAGIWDTNVVSTYEFTDVSDGMFVRIKSPSKCLQLRSPGSKQWLINSCSVSYHGHHVRGQGRARAA
jgi:hypothetical protein